MNNFNSVLRLLTTGVAFFGGFWLLWGVVQLAAALNDQNGSEIKQGIWKIVGGAMIIAASVFFSTLKLG